MNRLSIPLRAIRPGLALAFALTGANFAPQSQAGIDPAAQALAREVATKLGAAQTIRLTASHKIDPALGVGSRLEKGPLEITVKRPNRFYAIQRAGQDTREIAYDGKTLCLIHPELKNHALEPLQAGSIDQFADQVDARFGFRPPVAELLSADLATQLFRQVASATVTGVEWVGFTPCERLHFEQDGMTGDLWVGKKDRLPHRYRLTFTGIAGSPAWDIRLKKWELNPPVDELLFTKRPAAGSHKVRMLKAR